MNNKTAETLDLRQFFPYRLAVLEQRVGDATSRHYRDEFDLSRIEWRVIAALAMFDAISATGICDFTHIAKMQVSRAIARLKKKGLVKPQVSESDHRVTLISLSDDGRGIYRRIVPRVLAEEQNILNHLSAAEQGQLRRILGKLEDALA